MNYIIILIIILIIYFFSIKIEHYDQVTSGSGNAISPGACSDIIMMGNSLANNKLIDGSDVNTWFNTTPYYSKCGGTGLGTSTGTSTDTPINCPALINFSNELIDNKYISYNTMHKYWDDIYKPKCGTLY